MDDGFLRHPGTEHAAAERLIDDLARDGFAHGRAALPEEIWQPLRCEALRLKAADDLDDAGIGRGDSLRTARSIRRTKIAWLDGATPAQADLLSFCEDLRRQINRALFLGLFEFEAHFAQYPAGGFYARHLDAFRQERGAAPSAALGRKASRSRVVSFVTFLNDTWNDADGGELLLWGDVPRKDGRPDFAALDATPPAARIAPRAGDVVLMLSETIPHEVLETRRDRFGIAGWWRVNASVGGVVDPML